MWYAVRTQDYPTFRSAANSLFAAIARCLPCLSAPRPYLVVIHPFEVVVTLLQ
ncbi:hypothetical protein M404DRAFT_1001629 [Pisolithus tinctorius Marx 270]|uniref:Uncharacterized protein n=1 Tax=Pisolithus tinctorius Marx 270 TaxID=870435 RepID=A0A0C3P645_PISTI|nr:hypothetical protein M404DRAFT_1001629 [Pisolithus tinctorius Marx 270]